MDTCLSNFRQLFALDSPYYDYSFDLLDTGRYYLQFDRLMEHWQQALPGRILETGYESIVDDLEGSVRQLLEFCGLSWDPACLARSEEHTSELQSLMRISYAVFCLKKKIKQSTHMTI